MATMIDYLSWRGDLPFTRDPFNEVDNLILSELAYTKMEQIVAGPDSADLLPLREVCAAYERLGYKGVGNANNAYPLLKAAAATRRFGGIRVGSFVNRIDREKEIQFSAVTFFPEDGTAFIAFRGTDNSIVGWREDFNLSYLTETPGQFEAVNYLEQTASRYSLPIRVGGHSKGGNLAVYAAAFCQPEIKARILAVYSNDGPGFHPAVTDAPAYRESLDKVTLLIPEASVIGILLSNEAKRRIVRSSAVGTGQHNPYTWEVTGNRFLEADSRTAMSLFMDETSHRWIRELDEEQLKRLGDAVFGAMDASGAATLTEMNENKWASYNAIIKTVLQMDPTMQKELWRSARSLAATGGSVLWQEAKKRAGKAGRQKTTRSDTD